MALADQVKLEVKVDTLIQLTDVDNTGITSINDTHLTKVSSSVSADFELYVGVVYDNDNLIHQARCIVGVMFRLKVLKDDTDEARKEYFLWTQDLWDKVRPTIGANRRITPKSNSTLTPADETTGGEIRRPDFDPNSSFDSVKPGLRGNTGGGRGTIRRR